MVITVETARSCLHFAHNIPETRRSLTFNSSSLAIPPPPMALGTVLKCSSLRLRQQSPVSNPHCSLAQFPSNNDDMKERDHNEKMGKALVRSLEFAGVTHVFYSEGSWTPASLLSPDLDQSAYIRKLRSEVLPLLDPETIYEPLSTLEVRSLFEKWTLSPYSLIKVLPCGGYGSAISKAREYYAAFGRPAVCMSVFGLDLCTRINEDGAHDFPFIFICSPLFVAKKIPKETMFKCTNIYAFSHVSSFSVSFNEPKDTSKEIRDIFRKLKDVLPPPKLNCIMSPPLFP